jgi:hypothetical protein
MRCRIQKGSWILDSPSRVGAFTAAAVWSDAWHSVFTVPADLLFRTSPNCVHRCPPLHSISRVGAAAYVSLQVVSPHKCSQCHSPGAQWSYSCTYCPHWATLNSLIGVGIYSWGNIGFIFKTVSHKSSVTVCSNRWKVADRERSTHTSTSDELIKYMFGRGLGGMRSLNIFHTKG